MLDLGWDVILENSEEINNSFKKNSSFDEKLSNIYSN